MFFMGSWLCLHCEDLVLLLHLATGLHCPAPALESGCGVLVTQLGSVSWVCGLYESVCSCVSGIWGLCGCGFMSWDPGVKGSPSVSGVKWLAFSVHGLAWVVGTVLGLEPGSGVQILVLGLLRGPGSGLQGLSLSLASGVCEVMVTGSNSMPAGVLELGCGEDGNFIWCK